MNWSGDVLEFTEAEIIEGNIELAGDVLENPTGDRNATGRRQLLEPGGDIDAVTQYIAVIFDDVADMDGHTKIEASIVRLVAIAFGHLALHQGGTGHCVNHRGEFGEKPVASGFYDPPAMLADYRVEGTKMPLQRTDRVPLVPTGKGAEPGHIGD
jgi:hypothetical protein